MPVKLDMNASTPLTVKVNQLPLSAIFHLFWFLCHFIGFADPLGKDKTSSPILHCRHSRYSLSPANSCPRMLAIRSVKQTMHWLGVFSQFIVYLNMHVSVDIDECSADVGVCGGTCTNTEGSYECSCPEGLVIMSNNQCRGEL